LSSHAGQRLSFLWYSDASLRVSDRFRVMGPPAGTPLTFKASLHVRGYMGGDQTEVLAWIVEGTSNARSFGDRAFSLYVDRAIDTTLTVTVHRAAGEWFDLATMLWTWEDSGWGSMDG